MPGWALFCALAVGSPQESLHERATAAAIGAPPVVACAVLISIIYDARFTGVVEKVNDDELVVKGKFIHPYLKLEYDETRTFHSTGELKRNSFNKEWLGYNHSFSYRFSDTRVGDHVELRFNQYETWSGVVAIRIHKRPAGRVPPCPDTEGDEQQMKRLGFKWHEWRNAYWDLEEKGIPYPAHFGEHRRWPVAPPPRPVTRK